jgi:hypothetical protein
MAEELHIEQLRFVGRPTLPAARYCLALVYTSATHCRMPRFIVSSGGI